MYLDVSVTYLLSRGSSRGAECHARSNFEHCLPSIATKPRCYPLPCPGLPLTPRCQWPSRLHRPQPRGCPLSTSCRPRLPCPSPPHLPSPFSACSRWLPGPALVPCPIDASCHAHDLAPVPLPQVAVPLPSTDALCPGHVAPVCRPAITACRSPQPTPSPCARRAASRCRYLTRATAVLWSH